jgi:hypothetical protein
LVFSTSTNGKGWNGTIAGKPQSAGVYVWMVKAVDYTGAPYLQKEPHTYTVTWKDILK